MGRWIVISTHIAFCLLLMLCALLAAYMAATGNPRLQLNVPWDSILIFAVFVPLIGVVVCWVVFCLVFSIFLRRNRGAIALNQLKAIICVAIPIWGVQYYDSVTQRSVGAGP